MRTAQPAPPRRRTRRPGSEPRTACDRAGAARRAGHLRRRRQRAGAAPARPDARHPGGDPPDHPRRARAGVAGRLHHRRRRRHRADPGRRAPDRRRRPGARGRCPPTDAGHLRRPAGPRRELPGRRARGHRRGAHRRDDGRDGRARHRRAGLHPDRCGCLGEADRAADRLREPPGGHDPGPGRPAAGNGHPRQRQRRRDGHADRGVRGPWRRHPDGCRRRGAGQRDRHLHARAGAGA